MSAESATTLPALALEKCGAVVLDVAGTTTSINFIKETLFPFVTKQADEYLKANWDVNEVKEAVKQLKDEELDLEKATKLVQQMTEENSDNKGLKTIQGLIYKKGYESGELKAHVFEDVVSSLELWSKSQKIAIYSTGSIEAQKLLFTHTEKGDLTASIHKYFDQTVIGSKTESASYEKIIKDLELTAEQLLFITDSVEEAEAAKTAGLQVAVVKREGNADLPEDIEKKYKVIASFSEINFESEEEGSGKRKIDEENVEAPPTKLAKTEDTAEKTSKLDEKAVIEEKAANEEKKEEEKMEVDGAALSSEKKEKVKEPEKTEMETQKVEEKIPEKTEEKEIKVDDSKEEKMDSTEEKAQPVEEKEKDSEEVKKDEKMETKQEKVEESKEKPVEEEKAKKAEKPGSAEKVEEASSKSEKKDEEVKEAKENGAEENAKKTKETEKENKSELANGVGENGAAETSAEGGQEKVNGSNGNEESESKEKAETPEEIKTKKIEPESAEKEANAPAPVSVEV